MEQTLLTTTVAGSIASLAESYATYPLEYLKVREQIAVRSHGKFEIPHLTKVFYRGSTVFALGNVAKTAVRLGTFNWATKFMGDKTAPQVVVAGLLTGIAETLVVIPFESIKTTMIEASSLNHGAANGALLPPGSFGARAVAQRISLAATSPGGEINPGKRRIRPTGVPRQSLYEVRELQNLADAIGHMYRHRGLRAFVQGFNPTVCRQVANSFIRFTTYNSVRQVVSPGDGTISFITSIGISGVAAAAEAVITQPVDVVKSRMQTTNGIKLYGNSLLCAYRIFSEEGLYRLWAGLWPRWLRIWASGAVMWGTYELSQVYIPRAMREIPFSNPPEGMATKSDKVKEEEKSK